MFIIVFFQSQKGKKKSVILLIGYICFICGGFEPFLAKGASQVCQRASLLKPAIYAHLDISVNVPEQETIQNMSNGS